MAKNTIKIQLSVASVNDVIKRLPYLQDNIELACELTTEEIVNRGVEIANGFDAMTPKTGDDNYNFQYEIYGDKNNKGYIAMSGPDSVYVEFGTGDIGLSSPHPLHSSTPGIMPYNSGPTIKMGNHGHYWFAPPSVMTFQSYAGGYYKKGGYTQGIPAGCQMYNTSNELKNISPNIAKKYISRAIKKL